MNTFDIVKRTMGRMDGGIMDRYVQIARGREFARASERLTWHPVPGKP
jgi:hypothetical protein